MSEAALAPSRSISLTVSDAERIRMLIDMEGKPSLMLRLSVSGGGCSGFSYAFALDDAVNDDDQTFEAHGVKVVVDEPSLDLLGGSEVDFVEDLSGASFQVRNPNATSTCGCGTSFSL